MSNKSNVEQELFDSVNSQIKEESCQKDFLAKRKTTKDSNLQLGGKKQY